VTCTASYVHTRKTALVKSSPNCSQIFSSWGWARLICKEQESKSLELQRSFDNQCGWVDAVGHVGGVGAFLATIDGGQA
jgi:hypothetical protein